MADLPEAHRVAPTEVMILGEASVEVLERAVRLTDPDALVRDTSEGWIMITLEGPNAQEAFARLSELELPPDGFTQGEVASVGVRVLRWPERIELIVPAMFEAHVRARIASDREGLLS